MTIKQLEQGSEIYYKIEEIQKFCSKLTGGSGKIESISTFSHCCIIPIASISTDRNLSVAIKKLILDFCNLEVQELEKELERL